MFLRGYFIAIYVPTFFSLSTPLTNSISLTVGISPQYQFGTDGISCGVSLMAGVGNGWSIVGVNKSLAYNSSAVGTGNSGWESRLSFGVSTTLHRYNRFLPDVTLGSNIFNSGETSQRTGSMNVSWGKFSMMYENDWFFGLPTGDGGDRFRTTGAKLSWGNFSTGINLFTGDPGLNSDSRRSDEINGLDTYVSGSADKYRAGIFYFGYKNMRAGINSEKVRNLFQNRLAHKNGRVYPIFRVLDNSVRPYLSIQSNNPYTTW